MRYNRILAYAFFAWIIPTPCEAAQLRGTALVIGQSDYSAISDLSNPRNDSIAIQHLLEQLGFTVTRVNDRDHKRLTRDLDRFVEDASESDVALIYYAGHGIEAGGENWLVPVDAELNALHSIETELISFTQLMNELSHTAPLTIAFLDACRSNPFPSSYFPRIHGVPVAVASQGLAATRGFTSEERDKGENIGTVISFAASPGTPALDGEAGANSPYTAAIVRHLPAMVGEEFGTVLKMVAEEVYLATATRQRPWVNETLRKELYFGIKPADIDPTTSMIEGERRTLLLTISDLSQDNRKTIESISQSEDVPLDTLFGVLASLGSRETARDIATLERELRMQAKKIKEILDEKQLIAVDDPDLSKLLDAADTALASGAIRSARTLLEQAKSRAEQSERLVARLESEITKKRIVNASILARTAEAAELDFDYASAAKDYSLAYEWVKPFDPLLAARYKIDEAGALQSLGLLRGDFTAFRQSELAYKEALAGLDRQKDVAGWARAKNNLGNTLFLMGERYPGTEYLTRAANIFKEILAEPNLPREQKAASLSNLGNTSHSLADRLNDSDLFQASEKALKSSLNSRQLPLEGRAWAIDALNLANLNVTLAERNDEPWRLSLARRDTDKALTILDPMSDRVARARGLMNLASIRRIEGITNGIPADIEASIAIYTELLEVFQKSEMPMDWGNVNGGLAISLTSLGAVTFSANSFSQAIPYFENALEEITFERAPVFWAAIQMNYGMALQALGQINSRPDLTRESARRLEEALKVKRREDSPQEWAETQRLLAFSLASLASSTADTVMAQRSIQAYRDALSIYNPVVDFRAWRRTSKGLASALQGYGILSQDPVVLSEARDVINDVLTRTSQSTEPSEWALTMKDLATVQFMLGTTARDRSIVELSIRNYDLSIQVLGSRGSGMDLLLVRAMREQAEQALKHLN